MWLATKYAAEVKLPDLAHATRELGGTPDAILYRQLFDRYPKVKRGPDEDMSNHFSRLKREHGAWRSMDTTDADRRAVDPRAKAVVDEAAKTPTWATKFQEPAAAPEASPGGTPAGLPQRIPGWYTGDAMDAPPPGLGRPSLEQRNPGATVPFPERSPAASYRPDSRLMQDWVDNTHGASPEQRGSRGQQSIQDWVSGLRDKGITLNQTLQRPDAANNQMPPPPMRKGQDIWSDFVPRPLPRRPGDKTPSLPQSADSLLDKAKNLFRSRRTRTASTVVAEYIEGVLFDLGEIPRKTAGLHETMTGDGWSHHESGSGDWYEKKIGDKVHRIVRQEDGWIHSSGPTVDEMTNPLMFDNIHGAVMRANRSKVQVGFKPPPIGHQNLSSNSWSDER